MAWKFKFIGDPHDGFSGPETVTKFGFTFRKNGPAVTIPEGEHGRRMAIKLRGNSHFKEVK
ncbi:MAG: hypothetical protein OEY97_07775 [Nitrospirota bacterium]|nr:hypothetical protein [Gammaproteobacteria bacterium]MDH5527189.1 hypothetical protein [Nitrospirota bacterium]